MRLHPRPTTQRGTGSREEAHILNLFDLNYIPPLCIYSVIVVSPMSSILLIHEPDCEVRRVFLGDLRSMLRVVIVFWNTCSVFRFGFYLSKKGWLTARGTLLLGTSGGLK